MPAGAPSRSKRTGKRAARCGVVWRGGGGPCDELLSRVGVIGCLDGWGGAGGGFGGGVRMGASVSGSKVQSEWYSLFDNA